MAYRIVYGGESRRERVNRGVGLRFQTMTAVCLLLFTLAVSQLWPEGTAKLREYLLPGMNGTQGAVLELMAQIQAGEPVEQALTVFCRQIIEDGKPN